MSNKIYTIMLTVFTGLAIVLLGTWIAFSSRDTTATDTLQDAVKTALYESRDDSSRIARNTFVVNAPKFKKKMMSANIKEFDGKKITDENVRIYYIHDGDSKYTESNNNDSKYIPIKAVKVRLTLDTSKETKGKDKREDGTKLKNGDNYNTDEHVATYVIQTESESDSNDITDSDD